MTDREVRRAIDMIVIIGLTPGAVGKTEASTMNTFSADHSSPVG